MLISMESKDYEHAPTSSAESKWQNANKELMNFTNTEKVMDFSLCCAADLCQGCNVHPDSAVYSGTDVLLKFRANIQSTLMLPINRHNVFEL